MSLVPLLPLLVPLLEQLAFEPAKRPRPPFHDRLIAESVGVRVILPVDVLRLEPLEAIRKTPRHPVIPHQVLVTHLPFVIDLLYDQF